MLDLQNKKGNDRRLRAAHPERARKYYLKQRATNPEGLKAACRRWRRANPEKVREAMRLWRAANPGKNAAMCRKWQAANPEWGAAYRRKRQYGLTQAGYDAMLASQSGVCAVCKREPCDSPLQVDHCHATGAVRGLLCSHCNTMLGYAKDDPTRLTAGADYLKGREASCRPNHR